MERSSHCDANGEAEKQYESFLIIHLNAQIKVASSSYIQHIFKNIKGSSCLLREQGSTLHHDIQVSQRCWRVSIHGSECYMIRKEVGDLTGAVPPLIAVLKDALTA